MRCKITLACCIFLGIWSTIVTWLYFQKSTTNTVYYPYYKSVSHTEKGPAWELIKQDNDEAYYIIKNVDASEIPQINETIYFMSEKTGTISDVSTEGFVIHTDELNVKAGLSGTPVVSASGVVYGYISASLGNGNIFCVWR